MAITGWEALARSLAGRALSVGSQSCQAEETWWTLHPITLLYKSQGVAPLRDTWA